MSSVKMFRFGAVENMKTGEVCDFIGQGVTIEEAFKDAVKIIRDVYRPKSDGSARAENGLGVRLRDGRVVKRTLREFEGDAGYSDPAAVVGTSTSEILD